MLEDEGPEIGDFADDGGALCVEGCGEGVLVCDCVGACVSSCEVVEDDDGERKGAEGDELIWVSTSSNSRSRSASCS